MTVDDERRSGKGPGVSSPPTVALVVHHERQTAWEAARNVAQHAAALGHRVIATSEDAAVLSAPGVEEVVSLDDDPPDVVVGVGGDGTMLRAAHLVARHATPLIGVNSGQLGYLTEVEPAAATEAYDAFVAGRCRIEERMRLAATTSDGTVLTALNEVVVEKAESGHSVHLHTALDGAFFTTYLADGVIVATPTGSTAYALSARGPIVDPTHSAVVLTPVAAHQMFDRTLVLRADSVVTFEVLGHRPARLVVDGRPDSLLPPGSTVTCRAAAVPSRFVRSGPDRFHDVLKRKFHLTDR